LRSTLLNPSLRSAMSFTPLAASLPITSAEASSCDPRQTQSASPT
jgi:hypothetical protein